MCLHRLFFVSEAVPAPFAGLRTLFCQVGKAHLVLVLLERIGERIFWGFIMGHRQQRARMTWLMHRVNYFFPTVHIVPIVSIVVPFWALIYNWLNPKQGITMETIGTV